MPEPGNPRPMRHCPGWRGTQTPAAQQGVVIATIHPALRAGALGLACGASAAPAARTAPGSRSSPAGWELKSLLRRYAEVALDLFRVASCLGQFVARFTDRIPPTALDKLQRR